MNIASEHFVPNAAELPVLDPFRKATFSNPSGNCVDVAQLEGGKIAVRHTGAPDGVAIIYTADEWRAFTAGVKAGEFDFA